MNRSAVGALVVVGDALLDIDVSGDVDRLAPDAPVPVVEHAVERARPGGAALAAQLARRHHQGPVRFLTALGGDSGRRVRGLLEEAGVEVFDLGASTATPTKTRIVGGGQRIARVDTGGSVGRVASPRNARTVLTGAAAVLVSDYGCGLLAEPTLRQALEGRGRAPLVWDPHPRGRAPVPGATLVTPNLAEARRFGPEASTDRTDPIRAALALADALLAQWRADAVAITLGRSGALVCDRSGTPLMCPAPRVLGGPVDACGAGDAFSASVTAHLAAGCLTGEAVSAATATASDFVAGGGVTGVAGQPGPPRRTGPEGRPGGLVATSGCFDLLHVGHVRFLEAASRLGDRLVVLLNSDRSVRALKGPGRPVQHEQDRAAILASLSFVDDVVVFDEKTPSVALSRLRPEVFAKGGDYDIATLPEAATVAEWGGVVLTLPYHSGHSTTRLIAEARAHG